MEKGKNLHAANHTQRVEEIQEEVCLQIRGECVPETSINTYEIVLEIDGERRVADGGCQCVAHR